LIGGSTDGASALGGRPDGPRIGLVLGGGGIIGFAFHAGALATLGDLTGFAPRTAEIVVGTSAGAITAALLRGGVTVEHLRDRFLSAIDDPDDQAWIKKLAGRSLDVIPSLWEGPGSPAMVLRELRRGRHLRLTKVASGLLPPGRVRLDPIIRPIEALHGPQWPDQPLWITATDLETGHRVVFGRDLHTTVPRAVAASASVPGFFTPVEIGERVYVDGGLESPFNLGLLNGYRADDGHPLDLVVVGAPMSVNELNPTMPLASLARSLPRRRLQGELRRLEAEGVPILVLEPDRDIMNAMGLNPMDHTRVEQIITSVDGMVRDRVERADPAVRRVLDRAWLLERPPAVQYPEDA
jgi:NTE family protein